MPAVFAQRKQMIKEKVCYVQLASGDARWHIANMKYRIRELRKARGWTIEQMADLTAYSKGFLSQIETGKRLPSSETLDTIAQAMGVSVPDLYEDHDLGRHMEVMRALSAEDQAAVVRHARGLLQKVAE